MEYIDLKKIMLVCLLISTHNYCCDKGKLNLPTKNALRIAIENMYDHMERIEKMPHQQKKHEWAELEQTAQLLKKLSKPLSISMEMRFDELLCTLNSLINSGQTTF